MSVLKTQPRIKFDLNNPSHLEVVRHYITHQQWRLDGRTTGCPFEIEYPWTSVPDMIKHKLACRALGVI